MIMDPKVKNPLSNLIEVSGLWVIKLKRLPRITQSGDVVPYVVLPAKQKPLPFNNPFIKPI